MKKLILGFIIVLFSCNNVETSTQKGSDISNVNCKVEWIASIGANSIFLIKIDSNIIVYSTNTSNASSSMTKLK